MFLRYIRYRYVCTGCRGRVSRGMGAVTTCNIFTVTTKVLTATLKQAHKNVLGQLLARSYQPVRVQQCNGKSFPFTSTVACLQQRKLVKPFNFVISLFNSQ